MTRVARAATRWALTLAIVAMPAVAGAADRSVAKRDQALLRDTIAGLAAQRPGKVDLYVVGVAGDGNENVFRNEVNYLSDLMAQRFAAANHVVSLVNHIDSLGDAERPLATLDNLRSALDGVAHVMDVDEDVLLLFVTTHGTAEHELVLDLYPVFEQTIDPRQLRAALDHSGIRNRVVVVSSCYSGGFVPALADDDTLVITAAAADRTSFGCGDDTTATYFGRAWLVDGLNHSDTFVGAYDVATRQIAQRERAGDFRPSLPQISVGARILARLQRWRDAFTLGPELAYPGSH